MALVRRARHFPFSQQGPNRPALYSDEIRWDARAPRPDASGHAYRICRHVVRDGDCAGRDIRHLPRAGGPSALWQTGFRPGMRYVSTRGNSAPVDFVSASLMGLAPDGGLFSPETFPAIERPGPSATYVETATRILSTFAGASLPEEAIRGMAERAYAPFAHKSVAPLLEVGRGRWMMELHHGPTLAFKDGAMRLIAQLYDHILGARGERMTILCATSGDTGGAAASAFAGSKNVDMVILHPLDRVSPTQRLFMTATGADNVHNFALEGDFDGTQ